MVRGNGTAPDALASAMNTDTPKDQCGRADRPVVPATRARQGVTGHNVRYVLLLGTLAVVVLFGIVYIAYFT